MKTYRFVKYILVASVALLLFACSTDDSIWVEDGKEVAVSFRPTIDNSMASRAIGDAGSIDELVVGVYNEDKSNLIYTKKVGWDEVQSEGVALTLIEGRTYHILFWAQDGGNTAYTFTNKGIEVNYGDYTDGGFDKMEEMDAFYGTASVTVGSKKVENKGTITLTRPLAQINFADNTTQPIIGIHQAVVTFHGYPTSFNPFEGTVEMNDDGDKTFTFTDFPAETLTVEGLTFYYISSNYLFVPQNGKINVTLDLQNTDGTSIKTHELQGVTLEKNKKTNVLGAIVQEPETWSVWDGKTKTKPATDDQNRYVIDNAANIAWLGENASTLETNKTFIVTKDIDMAGKAGLSPINLPAGTTFEGQEHTIKGIRLNGAFLGNATNLMVQNLIIDDVIISNASSHVGVLVNTLKGSSSFTNVSITKSEVTTTNGAAGGMIGYVVRTTEKDRTEELNVSFSNCVLENVAIAGTASEGKFVGLLSGYDNNESLSFDAECKATNVSVADYTSVYTKTNNSEWAGNIDAKYNGWLGHETYRRAKVTFNNVRMAPRWDGKTITAKADLLLYNGESNKYEVHSPFDLAGVRDATASPAALYLMENVDMFGQGADGEYNVPSNWTQSANVSEDDKYFMSFSTILYLDGNDYGIYNLNINTQKVSTSLYYGGFIQSTTGTTTHKNIKFYNSCVVVPLVVYKNEDKGSAGMLVSNIAGDSYTMNNVHTYGCKIFALQKVGGIAARVAATTSTISNCSVIGGYIENYKCTEHKENFSKSAMSVTVSASFYSYGEVGGMFGFVEQNSNISNCKVTKTTIYAYGQDDIKATLSGNWILTGIASAAGLYKVPGRHVGTFIGDVRTTASEGGTITMTDCSVDSETKCTNHQHKHNNKCETIGLAYYLNYSDDEGTVNYNGTKLTLMNCSTYQTNRDQ